MEIVGGYVGAAWDHLQRDAWRLVIEKVVPNGLGQHDDAMCVADGHSLDPIRQPVRQPTTSPASRIDVLLSHQSAQVEDHSATRQPLDDESGGCRDVVAGMNCR
jgi:hypothetical protein